MGGEVFDAERVVVAGEQWHDVVHPAPDVRLAHSQLDLLVEHLHHRRRVHSAAIAAAAVKMGDGTERVMGPGDFFYVLPGHDSWVVGDKLYVSLHIMGKPGLRGPGPAQSPGRL